MAPKFFTVPNQLTFLRLGFLPLFLVLVMGEHYKWALAVLLLAAVSDALDEPTGSIPSVAAMFEKRAGRSIRDYLALFA